MSEPTSEPHLSLSPSSRPPRLQAALRADPVATRESQETIREIVACVDGSELGGRVLPHARAVAQAFGARLTLLRVLEGESSAGQGPIDPIDWEIRRREAGAELRDLAARTQLEDAASQLVHGRAAEQICRWAERSAADLTVFCSHGARGRTEWDLASTARKLIDRVPGSILLVPAATTVGEQAACYRRILVPLDGSPRAESVLPIAMRLAAAHGAELVLAHVVPAPELTRVAPLDASDRELEQQVLRRNERVARRYLDRVRARLSGTTRARAVVVRKGDARTVLPDLIDAERADLLVLSAHGHGNRTEIPCGSVAAHLVASASVPLLVVRDRPRLQRCRPRPGLESQLRLPHLDLS